MTDRLLGRWRGQTVVCAGSGPSLTAADLESCRGLPLIVTNTTWKLAPWADMLVAMDTAWWKSCGEESKQFSGERVSFTSVAVNMGASYSVNGYVMSNFGNSGAFAIAVAVRARAARVLLIGYDAGAGEDGSMHWHGDHPAPLKNPQWSIVNTWPRQFGRVAKHAKEHGTQVINCSRRTALACFERMTLEEALRIETSSDTSGFSTSEESGGRKPATPLNGTDISPGRSTTAAT